MLGYSLHSGQCHEKCRDCIDWQSSGMKKTGLISPITSLCFFKNYILSGQGPYLCIHDAMNGENILSEHVLGNSRIHAIKANPKEKSVFAVFGQRIVRLLEITNETSLRIKHKTCLISLPDLIMDVHWLSGNDKQFNLVAIGTAHNTVWCFNCKTGIKWQIAQCEENSILYSSTFFGNDLNNLLLACGTVFNQVLLWKVEGTKTEENCIKVISRLSGHEGVIFRVNFNISGTLMTSVSDDRSIRLWKLTDIAGEFKGQVECLLVLYGHSARVWDAKMLQKCIVSIGEDAVCNVWSYDGKLEQTFSGHSGRSIWSIAIHEEEMIIATGGGDGSIRLFSLDDINSKEAMVTVQAVLPGTTELKPNRKGTAAVDSPRSVALMKNEKTLVMTSKGYLYEYTYRDQSEKITPMTSKETTLNDNEDSETLQEKTSDGWKLLLHDSNYSSYSLMAMSPDRQFVAFGNLEGNIKVHETNFSSKAVEVRAFASKILSLLWLILTDSHSLFVCGPGGKIQWWQVFRDKETLQAELVHTFCIPYSKQRWASAVEVLDPEKGDTKVGKCHVVFGDRKGSIYLFDVQGSTKDEVLDPVHSIPALHGDIGVTQLCSHDNKLYSAGRDGTYRQYRLLNSCLEVIDTKKVFKGLEWVEKLIFTPNGDLVIAGFHTAYFIVWSIGKNQPLFKVKCGGGHRAWDFSLSQITGSQNFQVVFTYLKGNCVNVHLEQLKNSITKPVLQMGFHGREATCMCYVGALSTESHGLQHLFLTGSEDTTINLMLYNSALGCLTKIFTAQGHISSVRTLSVIKCTSTNISSKEDENSEQKENDYSTGAASTSDFKGKNDHKAGSSTRYLLFSGGGKASLRCWNVDPSMLTTSNQTVTSSSLISYITEYSSQSSRQKRKRKRHSGYIHSEIRFMSLSSFSVSDVVDNEKCKEDSRYLYVVAAACSDGFVRIFIFDENTSKFCLFAQSEYLQRCVLTVNHLVYSTSSKRTSVLIFAGDTAGKVSLWDITDHLLQYILGQDKTDTFSNVTMQTTNSCISRGTKEDESELSRISVSETSCQQGSSAGTSCSPLFREKNDRSFNSFEVKGDKAKFSCIHLVQNSLGWPLHVFRAHQSGVNNISIHKGSSSSIVCSGGDDGALFIVEFNLCSTKSGSLAIHVIKEEYVQSAHTSSITGIRVLDATRVISSSTDQRLKLWNISSEEDSSIDGKFVTLSQVQFIDVPDVQAVETWHENDKSTAIALCGVGLQMVILDDVKELCFLE